VCVLASATEQARHIARSPPLDGGAELGEFAHQVFVPPIDVEYLGDVCFPVRAETGYDQRSTSSDVAGSHRGTAEALEPAHDRMMAVRADIGTQPA
jgi:hypothetical protein